ncbi:MAG: zinc-ribbon domain-containing protein [Bradymonadales bacterium]|nr:zinc-ribbon domain-containing protein [Bradymonadales bacterium]
MDDVPITPGGTKECPKCGAPLPADDEVLCQNCGAAFGVKTTVIKAVTGPDAEERPSRKKRSRKKSGEIYPQSQGTGSPVIILVVIGLVAVIAALMLILILLGS